MAGITFYVGVYHLFIYLRRGKPRSDFTFAICCLIVCAYDAFCAGLYNASSVAEGVVWQRAQLMALLVGSACFLWFVSDYTGLASRKVVLALTGYLGLTGLIALLDPGGLTWDPTRPMVKHVALPFGPEVTYYEGAPGWVTHAQSIFTVVIFGYALRLSLRFYRLAPRKTAVPMIAALLLFFAGIFNDALVSSGVYSFVYTLEYAFTSMIVLGAYILSNEVVEAAMTREALRESEERLAITLHSIGDGVIATDREGRVTRMNRAAEELTGWPAEEAEGRSVSEVARIRHAESGEVVESSAEQVIRTGKSLESGQHRVLTDRGGGRHQIANSAAAIRDHEGRTVGAVLVFRDITEQHRIEEQLRQAQRMESLGNLAGGIAHDFNNLLSPILGYVDLALQELPEAEPLHEDLLAVRQAAERAAKLTRQLLAVSRKQVLEFQVLDINSVLSEAHGMLRRLVREDIEIELRLGADLGFVRADPSQIHQILLNLVVNACDAMPQGGRLRIETQSALLGEGTDTQSEIPPGPYVTLVISDTGAGISPELLPHIFDPFFTTKARGRGTGLGLATVLGIASQHGGSLAVRSVPGEGTAFRVYFPRVDGPTASRETNAAPVKELRGSETVLVMEDDESVRALTRDMLNRLGYEVLAPETTEQALELVASHPGSIDLLLTDVIMPGMTGRKLYEKARSSKPDLKVLFMSGYADDEIADHVLAGGPSFLQKPFSVKSLGEKLRAVLDD